MRGACLARVSAGVRFVCSVHFGACACVYARVLRALRGVVRSVGVCCVYVSVLCGARCVVHVRVSCVVCARALRLLCAGASCVGFVVCLRRVRCACVCEVIVSSVCVCACCECVAWCVVRGVRGVTWLARVRSVRVRVSVCASDDSNPLQLCAEQSNGAP